jgi:hypothetical protein
MAGGIRHWRRKLSLRRFSDVFPAYVGAVAIPGEYDIICGIPVDNDFIMMYYFVTKAYLISRNNRQ